MRIVVVGTSNSVMGNKGFLQSLGLQHEIIQLSSGRTPFLCCLKTIMLNKDLIESCDLLVLDHYINDVNFYSPRLGAEYDQLCQQFYEYLSSINTRILNLLFPIKNLQSREGKPFYELVKRLSHTFKIECVDLNNYPFENHHFKDKIHLTHDASYAMGIALSIHLDTIKAVEKPSGGACHSMPWSIVKLNEVATSNTAATFKNKLIELTYTDVKSPFKLRIPAEERLLSVGYICPKNTKSCSGFEINGKFKVGLSGRGYFHEIVPSGLFGDLHICPLEGHHSVPQLMGRKHLEGYFDYCFLTEMLFYNPVSKLDVTHAKHSLSSLKLPEMMNIVRRICPAPVPEAEQSLKPQKKLPSAKPVNDDTPKLQDGTIRALHRAAIHAESTDLYIARDIMRIALKSRPNGPVIKRKLDEYEQKISSGITAEVKNHNKTRFHNIMSRLKDLLVKDS